MYPSTTDKDKIIVWKKHRHHWIIYLLILQISLACFMYHTLLFPLEVSGCCCWCICTWLPLHCCSLVVDCFPHTTNEILEYVKIKMQTGNMYWRTNKIKLYINSWVKFSHPYCKKSLHELITLRIGKNVYGNLSSSFFPRPQMNFNSRIPCHWKCCYYAWYPNES